MSGSGNVVKIEILHVPGCPLVGPVRETVHRVLAKLEIQAEVEELVGEYPSPTLLIDGRDVTGRMHEDYSACRLDLPTEQQVLVALRRDSR
jgi:hypothetical protein